MSLMIPTGNAVSVRKRHERLNVAIVQALNGLGDDAFATDMDAVSIHAVREWSHNNQVWIVTAYGRLEDN
jgi:hypothetical protein